ncbi:MAG: transglycosylase domain-containing protein [Lachnospiraceae bacterium]|nr:transglycosylase domain-containing protein [Lachnospiraceae bacterium]
MNIFGIILKKLTSFLLRFIIIALAVLIVCAGAGTFILYKYSESVLGTSLGALYQEAKTAVEESTEEDFRLNQTSYIYDANGDLMTSLSAGSSQNYVAYEDIPENVINAFVAIEDKTFWTNQGFELKAIIRATWSYITTGEFTQGGSTITQQLVKLTFLSSEKTIARKAKEIIMAYYVTQKYSKEQIIEWYVNQCCFANGIYGITDAAWCYLGKSLDELTLGEVAYLCSIPNLPEYYNPWTYPENAIDRMKLILQDMYEEDYITESEYHEALRSTINLQYNTIDSDYDDTISYAIYCAAEYLMELNGFEFCNEFETTEAYESYWTSYNEAYSEAKDLLYTGGYSVYTSIQPDVQKILQTQIDSLLSFDSTLTSEGVYNLQGSATVIDNAANKVIAISGGRSQYDLENNYGINRAFQSTRQPGSAIKPILVYGPAVDNGYTADSILYNIDVQAAYDYYNAGTKGVDSMTGTAYSLARAVAYSYNACAVYLYNKITPEVGLSYARRLGLNHLSPEDNGLSAALGGLTYGTNTLEMAGAYSAFACFGAYTKPDCLLSILDAEGNEIYIQAEAVQVFEEDTARQMAQIMEGTITYGTASSMEWETYSSEHAAGKTGTTQVSADGWFCGFTDQYTIAVWVGTDDNTMVEGMAGGTYPASIWRNTMSWLLANKAERVERSVFD